MENKTVYFAAASAWTLFSGVSYLWGFWIPFDINILAYVAIADIVKASVYPALPAVFTLLFVSIYNAALMRKQRPSTNVNLQDSVQNSSVDAANPKGKLKKIAEFFRNFFGLFITIASVAWLSYSLVVKSGFPTLVLAYIIFSMVLFGYFHCSEKHLNSLHFFIRNVIFIFVSFIPLMFFCVGFSDGEFARNDQKDGYFITADGFCSSSESERFRYVGVLGDRLFSISSKDQSLCIMKAEEFKLNKYNDGKGKFDILQVFKNK